MDFLGLWKASSDAEEEIGDIPRKVDQLKHSYSNLKKHYEKLGSAGIKGSLYQIDVLTMVLLNAMRKVKSWRLSTENKEAAQFDDLIFEHLPSQSTILLQAKHKEDEKNEVTYQDLMTVNKNSEFSLAKYFLSYQVVKNRFRVQMVVICTNLKLDKKTKSILKEESVDPGSVLHFEGAENICYGFSGCSLPELKQNIKRYHAKYVHNEEISISDEDINDFLNHLKLFPNCLCDKNVGNVAHKTISRMQFSENLSVKMIQKDIHKKMTDWFKEKKGRYLYEVEAKAFFCDMRSNKYCEGLKLYDISFKGNKLPLIILQTRQENNQKGKKSPQPRDPKRISHIIPGKEYVLNVVKIYQALPTHQKETTLFVNPDEVVQVQKEIIDAFRVQHYTLLVMVCPGAIEEPTAKEMSDIVTEILDTYKYKHVILIAEERNSLATRIKNAYINFYEDITDNLTFADLEDTAQEEIKRNRLIDFQGIIMSLEELFAPPTEDRLNQIVNSEMLMKLARRVRCKVGLELPHLDNYYIGRSFNRSGRNISEQDLWRSTEASEEKIILISDSAGMGKSSVLASLAISIKKDNPHLWVVRIDLNNYTNVMEEALKEGRKSVGIVEMISLHQETSEVKGEFDKKLFATPKRTVLMLDGVDEISPTYTKLVVNLIRDSLAQVNLAKIIVTARPHMSKDFEEISELQLFTFEPSPINHHQETIPNIKFFTLEPFSKVNQKDFLVKYWSEILDLRDDARRSKCNIYAEALVENISVWLNEGDRNNFAGIPLQTRMLAEIFQDRNQIHDDEHGWEGCKEFISSNNDDPKFPKRFDIIQLYKLFIDKKCDIFIKRNNPTRSIVADEALKHQLETCQKFHRAVAIKAIFDSHRQLQFFTSYTNVEWPIPTTFANDYLLKVGIVQRQGGGNIEFLHRTIAEYFVAECLLIELDRQPIKEEFQQFFMDSIMMHKEFYVIRAFLNSRTPNVLRPLENNFCSYSIRNRTSERSLSRHFEVLAEEGHARILECIVKCIDKEQREVLSETMDKVYLMYNALYSAIRYGHLNILQLLLELNETFNKGKNTYKEFLKCAAMYAVDYNLETLKFLLRQVDKDGNGRTALHEAAFMGWLEQVESLVEHSGVDINTKDNILGWTALHEAVLMGRLEIVKFFVEKARVNVNVKDNYGRTALHRAAHGGKLEIVKLLVEAEADINIKGNYGETALHNAASCGRFEAVKFLVEKAGADINIKNDYGKTALYNAATCGSFETVKFLVEKAGADINIKDNYGKTALHRAAYEGQLRLVKFLVEKAGADINIKDDYGKTALHNAASCGKFEAVKFLVENAGADINIKDDYGKTALHNAASCGRLEAVEFLLNEAGADINIKDDYGKTALHIAAAGGRFEVVKFLVEEAEADINIKDKHGETALHNAASCGRFKVVKFLVKEAGADINNKDNNGETALHAAAYGCESEMVKYLVEEAGADVNILNKKGWTALQEAAREGELETVKFLVEAGADINIKNSEGRTALQEALIQNQLQVVKFLVQKEADVNNKDNYGETALHRAASYGRLKVVKVLVEKAGADINIKDSKGNTALYRALSCGRLQVATYLVGKAKVDVNIKNNEGWAALHLAVNTKKIEIVKCLVEEAGANVNIKTNGGVTALHTVAYLGGLDTVKYLVEVTGADMNIKNNEDMTALQVAVFNHHFQVAIFLVEKGADVNNKDDCGETALHIAASYGSLELVRLLVNKAGADISIKDNNGNTALDTAVRRDRQDVVEFLRKVQKSRTSKFSWLHGTCIR